MAARQFVIPSGARLQRGRRGICFSAVAAARDKPRLAGGRFLVHLPDEFSNGGAIFIPQLHKLNPHTELRAGVDDLPDAFDVAPAGKIEPEPDFCSSLKGVAGNQQNSAFADVFRPAEAGGFHLRDQPHTRVPSRHASLFVRWAWSWGPVFHGWNPPYSTPLTPRL
jgi:hypothetical protein